MLDNRCIFCNIINGQASSNKLFWDDQVTAFRDIHPITPVHILVVPNKHLSSISDTSEEDEGLLGHMLLVAKNLAWQEGLQNSGYRLVINTGTNAGQSVHHLHLHLIGGRHMPFKFE